MDNNKPNHNQTRQCRECKQRCTFIDRKDGLCIDCGKARDAAKAAARVAEIMARLGVKW